MASKLPLKYHLPPSSSSPSSCAHSYGIMGATLSCMPTSQPAVNKAGVNVMVLPERLTLSGFVGSEYELVASSSKPAALLVPSTSAAGCHHSCAGSLLRFALGG